MKKFVAALAIFTAVPALAQADPAEANFRKIYRELVETNTTLSAGDCTKAANQVAVRLKAAGYPERDVHVLVDPEHPREGNLVAVLPGKDPAKKAILLLAHIDVVEANREDWERDPFTLYEENGYFFGRGVVDNKAQAAIFADTMIRLKSEPRLKRTVKLALTCGEETASAFNGAEWLASNHRQLIDAEFAMNEGGGGTLSKDGKKQLLLLQVGEKHYQDFTITVTNPGGHSSRPVPENAIYQLAAALKSIEAHEFPVRLNDITRISLKTMVMVAPEQRRADLLALLDGSADAGAHARLSADASINSVIRTTCIPTMVMAGHAVNALPQRATANVNCRIIPGETVESTLAAMKAAVNDPQISFDVKPTRNKIAEQPPLTERIYKPVRDLAAKHFPSVPVMPFMISGATDAPFLAAAGIPVYGVPGIFFDPDGNGAHGLNERVRVKSVLEGRAFLHDLLKAYANH